MGNWCTQPETGGLEMKTMKIGDSSVEVYLHGATVTSWTCRGRKMLFVSKRSRFDPTKAIRGGIPVVFPRFGPWEDGPQHGFARTMKWSVRDGPSEIDDGEMVMILELSQNPSSLKMWPYKFELAYHLKLQADTFTMMLDVSNTGDKPFEFNTLLHTYFRVSMDRFSITGLRGCTYKDKVLDGKTYEEDKEPFVWEGDGCVDRVYKDTAEEHLITGFKCGHNVTLRKEGFPDTVIWNPGKVKAEEMVDFGDFEFKETVCVEAGVVAKPIKLLPGKHYVASQSFTVD